MEFLQERVLSLIPDTPLVSFTILILVALFIPPIFEKFRLPGLVGLLVAGVILGPDSLKLLDPKTDTIKLLSDAGKIYLMFVAGLEIDLNDFRKKRDRSLVFGLSTFAVPMLTGIAVSRVFGFSWNAAVLIGSLLASHTLLGYPIVNRLGIVRNEAITATIGATIFTDISALLVLAICVSIHSGEFTLASLLFRLIALALYSLVILVGLDRAGKEYFRRTGDEESNQFLFVLASVFLAAVVAQIIDIENIVGAFLAGLAVNDVLGHGPVKEKVEFVGSTLFIPFFFIGMGLLLNIPTFIETVTSQAGLGLTFAIVFGLIGSKFLATLVPKFIYRYSWDEAIVMWSLSMPQVAATLAAALVAYQAQNPAGETLISKGVFNTVIVMMLVTSIIGPVLTEKFAKKLSVPQGAGDWEAELLFVREPATEALSEPQGQLFSLASRVVVPIYNLQTQRFLIEMGAMLVHREAGELIPLSVVRAHVHMDEPQLNDALLQSQERLTLAREIAEEFGVEAKPMMRIDDNVTNGISRAARERQASLVLMGWSPTANLRSRLFGNIIDRVFWASHCPVAVMRLLQEPRQLRRVLVPVGSLDYSAMQILHFARLFAETNNASVTLLRVWSADMLQQTVAAFERELQNALALEPSSVPMELKSVIGNDIAQSIVTEAQNFDLAILRSRRRRTVAGLAISDVTTETIKRLNCSLILFGEPHS